MSKAPWSHCRICIAIDVVVLAAALVLAFALRYEGLPPARMLDVMWIGLLPVVCLQYGLLAWFKVPSASWRFFGIRDLPPILWSLGIGGGVVLCVRYAWGIAVGEFHGNTIPMIPASVAIIDTLLALLGITGARCIRRLQWQRARRRCREAATTRTPAILIGAGWTGSLLVQELEGHSNLGLVPVAFVDDDRQKIGRMVGRVPVVGTTQDLRQVSQRYGAKTALITISEATGGAMRSIVSRCKEAGLQAKIVPHIHEIVSGKVRVSQIRDVAIEDLLGRKPVVIDRSVAESAVRGKVALVTGAGGSIGSELCRQILLLRPKTLVLVERSENSLYEIHRELIANDRGVHIVPEVADVGDIERMDVVFTMHRPAAVFHAAAHKHVPMMERNPGEAIKNNLFGTKAVADLADRHGVERFILVSTDKAVNPSSVMGATKRLAELYIKDLGSRSAVRYTSVRFGNVMGSNGSVIPLFREQISKGGPVTVTHPDMERFFMTIPEASRLVLEAAGLSKGGEVMLLDMGEPVRIRYLAEQMIRLSGFEPYSDIDITFTGMRPGEKLYEELALPEETTEETACSKVFVWRGGSPSGPMQSILSALATPGRTPDEIRQTLRSVLPEYRHPQSHHAGSISA